MSHCWSLKLMSIPGPVSGSSVSLMSHFSEAVFRGALPRSFASSKARISSDTD